MLIRAETDGRETLYLDMDHLLVLLLLSSAFQVDGNNKPKEPDGFRLVGGDSRCAGTLELKHEGEWRPVSDFYPEWTLKEAAAVCTDLDCGSAVFIRREGSSKRSVWRISFYCVQSGSLRECAESDSSYHSLNISCSDSVRLVNGTSLCSGRLEVKSAQSNQSWSSVCEADFDQQDAEVVCRELGCGAPSVLQGALYGEVEAPMWPKEFQCGGNESSLLDCRSSGSDRNSCSPGRAVGLTCSEPVRLLGGDSRCAGTLELKHEGEWRPVSDDYSVWTLKEAAVVCRDLDCGSAVSLRRDASSDRSVWWISSDCVQSGSLRECATSDSSYSILNITCSAFQVDGNNKPKEPLRLVGGDSRCAGTLELKHEGEWRPVDDDGYAVRTLKEAAAVCTDLDCGSAVFIRREGSSKRSVWRISSYCVQSGSLRECAESDSSYHSLNISCSDSVRLVDGTSLCSGRLEVKSDQSNQSWSSVCEADFDQQDAEVVCRELGCGAPSVLQGALYGEVEAPMWPKEFQCGGDESALLDCRSSESDRNSCSPGRAVGLTCSEPVRLVGGDSRCAGTLELKHEGEWRPVNDDRISAWTLKAAKVFCTDLDCGSAVSVRSDESSVRSVWTINSDCAQSGSLRDCAKSSYSDFFYKVTCSDSVRLVNGTSLCSGRLEVKSAQSNQSWSSVCEADFDQQDAEVVCRELGCGAPSVLQGALYGEVEAPMWPKEFQCGGNESSLLDCRSSESDRNSCSPGRAVGLTCSESESVRLVGGDSRCAGMLEVKHEGQWRPVTDGYPDWTLKTAAAACTDLDCGSAVFIRREHSSDRSVWWIRSDCVQSGSLRECARSDSSNFFYNVTCSDSVRLVNGTSLCSGRLEVKSAQSNQSWSSVCEADFDQQDAEVVCRELGCGASSVLQGALYGEVEAPMWPKEFQCGGNESALLDCRSSGSDRNSCSPGRAVGLTCSEPVRLVGGDSRCAGTLEVKYDGEWRPVTDDGSVWTLKEAAAVCRDLDCGSAVSVRREESEDRSVWMISSYCVQSGSLRECATSGLSFFSLNLTCSGLLLQPNISMDGVSEAQQQGLQVTRGSDFTVSCSIQPQYPGGSFQLSFTSSNSAHNYTQPAVNHSTYFLFPAAEPAHQGSYSCVYHAHVFSHDFSSESRQLSLTVGDPRPFIIRVVVLPLILLLANTASYFYFKACRGQKPGRQEDMELDYYNLGVPAAEGGPAEEEAAQRAE